MGYLEQQQMIEDSNYRNDPRTQQYNVDLEFDEASMTLTWEVEHDCDDSCPKEGDSCPNWKMEEIVFKASFGVCDLCDGKGSHVNPSIDCGGISDQDDDFWHDDYDEESGESRYMRGDYDQTCNKCHGQRVAPHINRAAAKAEDLKRYDDYLEGLYEDAAERASEARWGC